MFQSEGFWTNVWFSRKLLFSPSKNSFDLQRFCYSFTSSSKISIESSNSKTTDDIFTEKSCFRTILLQFDSFLFEQLENHLVRKNWPQTCPIAYFDKLKAFKILLKLYEFILITFEQEVQNWKKRKKSFFLSVPNFLRSMVILNGIQWVNNGSETFCYFFWCHFSKICKSLGD